MNQNYTVIRSSRKTLGLQITQAGELIVRAPNRLPQREIDRFLKEKEAWIEKTLAKVQSAKQAGQAAPLTDADIRALADRAVREIPPRVAAFAARMQVTYGALPSATRPGGGAAAPAPAILISTAC